MTSKHLAQPQAGGPLDHLLCFEIYATHQAFGQLYAGLLKPLELTYPQYLVMVTLWAEDARTVSEIGQCIGLESSTLTPLLKRLAKAGLIERTRDSEDERRVRVMLTAKGRALQADAAPIPACVGKATGLSSVEIAELQKMLARTRTALNEAADKR